MNSEIYASPEQNLTAERLKSLYELIGRMNTVFELRSLLEFVVDRALSLTGGKRGLILLSDDHHHKLEHIAVLRGEKIDEQHLARMLQFVSTTVITDVLEQGEPRLVRDLQTDHRYDNKASESTLHLKKIRSVLACPLKIETKLVGLMYIDHPKKASFEQADLDFLSAYTNQAALAIHRARQHERQMEDLTRLNQISRDVAQVLDLDDVLARIIHEAIHLLRVKTGAILLLDDNEDHLHFAIAICEGKRLLVNKRLQANEGIAGWVIDHGQPLCLSNVQQDPRWGGEVIPGFITHSILCVPLEVNKRVVGVLEVLNKPHQEDFVPRDVALLSALAASAAVAIENARLFQEARQAHRLEALNEMALTLTNRFSPSDILDTGLSLALEVTQAWSGFIEVIDIPAQDKTYPLFMSQGLLSTETSDTLTQEISALRAMFTLSAEKPDPTYLIFDRTKPHSLLANPILQKHKIKALVVVPIKIGEAIKGVLLIAKGDRLNFSHEDAEFLLGAVRIISLAMQNTASYSQVRQQTRQLTYLNTIGSALTSSLDLDHVLEVVIEGVNDLIKTERTSVFLIDPENNDLVLRYSNEGLTDIRLPPPWQGIAGWVARHDKPSLVNDTLRDDRHLREVALETGYEAHSILCVPLKIKGKVIGVVEVLNKLGGQQFTEDHQELLLQFTKWAAIAIHNARLFNELKTAYKHLDDEQERRIAAETRTAMAAIILDMAHTMNNIVGAIRVWASDLMQSIESGAPKPLTAYEHQVSRIQNNANEAIRLISNMTDPLEQATIAPTNVQDCIMRAIQSCWWPDSVSLHQDYRPDLPLVKANDQRLEAVFHNLISNANQALAETGGDVFVKTELDNQGCVLVKIKDNGPGISDHLQDRIFNPGVSGRHGGLGIGLWLVENFINQFDGRIDFRSVPGVETEFTVTLQTMPLSLNRHLGN